MAFYDLPKVYKNNETDTWFAYNYENCTADCCEVPTHLVYAGGVLYVPTYSCVVGGYSNFLGSYTGLWINPTTMPVSTWWGWNDGNALYEYTTFQPGIVWDTITMSLPSGAGYHYGASVPSCIAVGVDGSVHWLQPGSDGYTYYKNSNGLQHTLGQASRAPGVGHLTAQMMHAVSANEIYVFYEKAVSTKFPIHVWKWGGTSWASPVQIQASGLATASVHYSVKGIIRADSTNPQHVLLVLSDGQLIWVDLSNNTSSSAAITTGLPIDEWPQSVAPPVFSSSNYSFGFNHAGGSVAKLVWTNANWQTPTVTKWSTGGAPVDSTSYDTGYGDILYTWGFACNPATQEVRGVALAYGQAAGKYALSAASIDLMAGSPAWNNYRLISHQDLIWDTRNFPYPGPKGYSAPRSLGYGTDWTNTKFSSAIGLLGVAGTSGYTTADKNQKYLIDWWTQGDSLTIAPSVSIAPVLTITINPSVGADGQVTIAPLLTLTVTAQETLGWGWNAYYTLLTNSSVVSSGLISIDPQLVLTITPDDTQIRVMVQINPTLALTVTGSVFQLVEKDQQEQAIYWDLDFTDAVLALVNADRASQGLTAYKLMTNTIASTQPDPSQFHADDMANTGVFAVEDTSFPVGRQTFADRKTMAGIVGQMNEAECLQRLKLTYTNIGDTDTTNSYSIINQYTVMTAQEMYDWLKAHADTTIVSFNYSGPTEIYLQIGVAYAPSATYYPSDKEVQWFCIVAADYTGYIVGGGGGGGGTLPTPYTNQFGLQMNAPYLGTSWFQEFIVLVNERRTAVGLLPFLDPTPANYLGHLDIAQQHSIDMIVDGVFAHESTSFPVGWQLVLQRFTKAQVTTGAENLLAHLQFDTIYSDSTFPTPQSALDSWWNSPPHRANLMNQFNGIQMTGYLGVYYGPADPVQFPGDYAWYLTHNMLDLTERVVEINFNVNYQFNGALIEWLIESAALYAYTNVRQANKGTWSIRIGVVHEADYGCRVSASHEALLQYSLQQGHEADYVGTVPLGQAHEGDYRLWSTIPVVAYNEADYGWRVLADNQAQYEVGQEVKMDNSSSYSLMARLEAANTGPYAASFNVRQADVGDWDIKNTEIVRTDSKAFWSISNTSSISVNATATLAVGGRTIQIADAVISQSDSTSLWEAKIRLADVRDYVAINDLDAVVLTLGGEVYNLIVTGKSVQRSGPAAVDAQLSAKSPLVLKAAPYQPPTYTYTYNTPMQASAIVAAMIGTVNWQIADWVLPADRVNFTNVTPFDAATRLVAVAGGIIQSEKDGTVTVQSLYPVPVDFYATTTPNQVFTDEEDTLSVSEDHEVKDGYNLFRIREGQASFADRMEWVADPKNDPTKGTVRVYPSPWRTTYSAYVLDTMTLVQAQGEISREESQLVQFSAGVGSLSFPITAINSITWYSAVLGGLSFDPDSTTLNAAVTVNQGYGLAMIKYQTRAFEYSVKGILGTSSLMLVEDLGA